MCGNQWVQRWLDPNTLHLQGVDTLQRCCGWDGWGLSMLSHSMEFPLDWKPLPCASTLCNPAYPTRTSWCLGPKHHRLDAMPLRCCSHRHFLLKQGSGARARLFLPNALSRNVSCIGGFRDVTRGQSHADVPNSNETTPALLSCQLSARVTISAGQVQ